METLIVFFQVVCLIGGVLTLYIALFSYEDEDEKLQDSLEVWWVQLRDIEGGMWLKSRELIRKSNDIVERCLNRLFGNAILSKQFISVSTVLSFVPAVPVVFMFMPVPVGLSVFVSLFLLWRALLPLKTGKPPHILASMLFVCVLVPLLNLLNPNYTDDYEWVLVIAGLFSLLSDVIVTIVIRRILRVVGTAFPLLFFIFFPIVVFFIVALLSYLSIAFLGPFSWILVLVLNLPALFFSFLIWFVPFMLIVGKIAIHIIGRGIYSMQRRRVFHNKKFMWGVAVLQFSAIPLIHKLVETLR